MSTSIFDLFTIGVGPSSSHTVGPMKAGYMFIQEVGNDLEMINHIKVHVYGPLALTLTTYKTDVALMLGLLGQRPDIIDLTKIDQLLGSSSQDQQLKIGMRHKIPFEPGKDIILHQNETLPKHPNGMTFEAYGNHGECIKKSTIYSLEDGLAINEEDFEKRDFTDRSVLPFPFFCEDSLKQRCEEESCAIHELVFKNELVWHDELTINAKINEIWFAMQDSILRGCISSGLLSESLEGKRRAKPLLQKLNQLDEEIASDFQINWLSCYAMAVNEENALGGRVVAAPTNNVSGILPSLFQYSIDAGYANAEEFKIYILTAGAIAMVNKKDPSTPGAGLCYSNEIGIACAMAAAALCALKGGEIDQILHAARMGLNYHSNLSDADRQKPSYIPCIEHNAMGAVQAYHCANLALLE